MPRLIWTPPALRDVRRLHRFPADKNVKAIRESVKVLARQPGIGRPADDMEPEYREWIIDLGSSGYVALYRYDGEAAAILAVRHQKEGGYEPMRGESN